MASPFSFEPMLVFGWLASMLLLGVLLRARIHFFQRFLFPGCLIGGIAGLVLVNTRIINTAAYVLGDPDATVFAFGSKEINIYELSARMAQVGWYMEAQQLPPSLHMTVSPVHLEVADQFLDDLRRITPEVPAANSQDLSEQAAMYAMLGTMPDRGMAREFAVEYMNNLYRVT